MKPNILFIMTDQFAYHATGYAGASVQTPHLDAIAKKAYQYTSCYCNAPLCMPARASLATGLYPQELGIFDNSCEGLTIQSKTWMQSVRDSGYQTALFGKAHLHKFSPDMRNQVEQTRSYGYDIVDELPGPRTYGIMRSSYYDHLQTQGLLETYREDMERRYVDGPVYNSDPTPLDEADYADVYIADKAVSYLNSVSKDKPWFCTVGFGGPHDPWDAPERYTELYKDSIMPKPLAAPRSMNENRPRGVYDEILSGRYDDSLTTDICRMQPEDISRLRKSYYGHITLIDTQIGRILDILKHRDMLNNTIVVFTSDHGEQNGDYGLLFKQTFLESSVRVPLLLFVPNHTGGVVHTPVELMDVGATICHLLKLENPMPHGCILPQRGKSKVSERHIVSQLFGETMLLCNGIKAVFNAQEEIYMLFNLQNDPQEIENLAATQEYADVEQQMKSTFKEWKKGAWA